MGLTLSLSLAGCGGDGDDGLPRVAVSGSVTLDGKPLASGAISFMPESQGQVNPVSVGAVISRGSYTIPREQGPTPGKYRVGIISVEDGPPPPEVPGLPPRVAARQLLPERYNSRSTLTAEVKAAGASQLDYALSSH
jgi:hypothetical protein